MSAGENFQCKTCGTEFTVPAAALAKYPGWKPSICLKCKDAKNPNAKRRGGRPVGGEENLTLAQVLERYDGGPDTGFFTDGSASPNPGPGGWGLVYVCDGEIIDQLHDHVPDTTNNRMELTALIKAYEISPADIELDVWTDSDLCVKSMTQWAPAWEKRGWRRKGGAIKNLELVQELYAWVLKRPKLKLQWLRAHDGSRWNEYADSLASAWMRETL